MYINPLRKVGPLYLQTKYKDTKDPCPVFDGKGWHIFASGGSIATETWKILHATASDIWGPWTEQEACELEGLTGDHVAAPGVVYEDGLFHMFVQRDFLATEGGIEYLTSPDGHIFTRQNTALDAISGTGEAGLYDPHPALVNDEKFVVYSGTPRVQKTDAFFISQPNIYLAKSTTNSWSGPWERMGKILDHTDIAWHHNQVDHPDYEWGIEGPQLVGLPNGKVLLNATSFLPEGVRGTRQRVFFALADNPEGPYRTFGPVLTQNLEAWESGENGHAAAVRLDDKLYLFYQARPLTHFTNFADVQANSSWRYGIAEFDLAQLENAQILSEIMEEVPAAPLPENAG